MSQAAILTLDTGIFNMADLKGLLAANPAFFGMGQIHLNLCFYLTYMPARASVVETFSVYWTFYNFH